jgi:hypothetical protein
MRRVLLVVVIGAAAILGLLYVLRQAEHPSTADIASLLPRGTVVFAQLPDFNAALNDWHHSDIYQIYREPAVQEFLAKPRSRSPKSQSVSTNIHDIEELDPRDAFIAVTSVANDKPKVVAGFRFRGSQQVVDRLIAKWRAKINPSAKQEKVSYQQHQIELFRESAFALAWVQDRKWIFAANDIDELKTLLDRADGRAKDPEALLQADAAFHDAIAAMPSSYAFLVYLQPKALSERLAAVRRNAGAATAQQPLLIEQIHSICATTRFDNGKMHDVIFVGMPKQEQQGELTRSSAALGTRDTFLYGAALVNFSKQLSLLTPGGGANVLGAGVQKLSNALSAAGIASGDWESSFGYEIGILCDWSEQARWPSLLLTLPVKDEARAKKIVGAMTRGMDEDGRWQESDRDGVHYWSLTSTPTFLSLHPVIGLSSRLWIAGLDIASVEAAMQRSQKSGSEFVDSDSYRKATRLAPTPSNFFSFVDPGLLYSRLDATVRPILLMGAAFVPTANDYVDLSKFPPPEAITRHLSPIVSSQYYRGTGYISESIGPLTLNQSGIGVGVLAGLGAYAYRNAGGGWNWLARPGPPATSPSATPSSKTTSPGPQPNQTP